MGKSKWKDFIIDKLVQCRFMYYEPNEYEILGKVDTKYTEYNKDGVIVLKQKKLWSDDLKNAVERLDQGRFLSP